MATDKASRFDSIAVAGLDIAIYRDSTGRFDFVDTAPYLKRAAEIDRAICGLFRSERA